MTSNKKSKIPTHFDLPSKHTHCFVIACVTRQSVVLQYILVTSSYQDCLPHLPGETDRGSGDLTGPKFWFLSMLTLLVLK